MTEPNKYDAIIADTEKFGRSLDRSNLVEISVGIFVVIVFSLYIYVFRNLDILVPVGSGVGVLGVLYIIIYIFRFRRRKGDIPSKENHLDYFSYWLEWHNNTLKLARRIFWWYILPVIPGFVLFIIGMIKTVPQASLVMKSIVPIFGLMVGGMIYWLNRYYAARKLQIKIDALNATIDELRNPGTPEIQV